MGSKAEKEKDVPMKKRVIKMDQMIIKWRVNTSARMEHVEHEDIWVSVDV